MEGQSGHFIGFQADERIERLRLFLLQRELSDAFGECADFPRSGESDALRTQGWVLGFKQRREQFFGILGLRGLQRGQHGGVLTGAFEDEGHVVAAGGSGEGFEPLRLAFGIAFELRDLITHDGGGFGVRIRRVGDGGTAEVLQIVRVVLHPAVLQRKDEVLILLEGRFGRPKRIQHMQRLGERMQVVAVEFFVECSRGDYRRACVGDVAGGHDGFETHERIVISDLSLQQRQSVWQTAVACPRGQRAGGVSSDAGVWRP